MRNFRNLEIWKKSMMQVTTIYKLTSEFPPSEKYGLKSQMQRSAVSIPSNIAEGSSRSSNKDNKRFLEIALGSAFELETQLIISNELYPLSEDKFKDTLNNLIYLQRQISALINTIKNEVS